MDSQLVTRQTLRRLGQIQLATWCLVALLLGHTFAHEQPPAQEKAESVKAESVKAESADAFGKPEPLFNGKDLSGWQVIKKLDFARHGKVSVADGTITMAAGQPASGIHFDAEKRKFPRSNYEVSFEAKRTAGQDFFCGLTFPVDKEYCTLILGGWGGGTIGLSNINNAPADENQTTNYVEFKNDQWYKVQLRVTDKQINVWIDKEHLIELERKDHKFSIWWEQEPVRPFGFATWYTGAAYRNIQLRTK
jgi:hypothetical protein